MNLIRVGAVALLMACLGLGACGYRTTADAARSSAPSKSTVKPTHDAPSRVRDITARGHAAFGCALERGVKGADAETRHYADLASHELFRAAFESRSSYKTAALLWNASDALDATHTNPARSGLLKICSAAGLRETAGLSGLRSYMCALTATLARDRPSVGSYGPPDTYTRLGDPRRSDASFIEGAQYLLSLKVSPKWFEAESPWLAMTDGNNAKYQTALRRLNGLCRRSS